MSRHYRFREFLPVLLDTNPTALFVYDYLESRRNIRGRAYPSLMTIAQELKRSERTIRRCIDLLMSYGVLRLVPYKERVDEEKKVHNSRKVYEFTGKANVNGKIIPLEYEADKPKRLILRMPLRPRKMVHVDTHVQMENESHVDTHVQWTPMSHLSIKRTNNIESFKDVLPEVLPEKDSKRLSPSSVEEHDEAGTPALEATPEPASTQDKPKVPLTEWVEVDSALWKKYPERKWFKVLSDGKPLATPQPENPPDTATHRKRGKHGREIEAAIGNTVWLHMMPMTFMAYFTKRKEGSPIKYLSSQAEKDRRFTIIRNEWKGKNLAGLDVSSIHLIWQRQTEFGMNPQFFAYSPHKVLIALQEIKPPPSIKEKPSDVIYIQTPAGRIAMTNEEYQAYLQEAA